MPVFPRIYALDLFQHVVRHRKPLDHTALGNAVSSNLTSSDQAFAQRLVKTALRRLGQIDAILSNCLDRPLPAKARIAQDVLRLGVAQLLFMEIPDHAAVHTSVQLFRARGEGGYTKLINGVLRRIAREGHSWIETQDGPRLNTPDWLWVSWCNAYGMETCRAIATAHLEEPPLDITVKNNPEIWADRLGAKIMPGGTLRLRNAGAVSKLPGYKEGAWWVQDITAHIISRLIGDIAGKTVIALCAAPGCKTATLINSGAHVTAVDRSRNRLKRLRENLARLNFSAEIIEEDAETWRPHEMVDAVFLDAPCSATGTIRRHPDIIWGKSKIDVEKLAAVQLRLITSATEMLKSGGILVYTTCSLQPEEGHIQVEKASQNKLPLKNLPVAKMDVFGLDATLTPEGYFRSLPNLLPKAGHLDGFFACRFKKI